MSAGEQPLKMVKLRAGTLNKMREVEVRRERELAAAAAGDGDEQGRFGVEGDVMQGLYGRHQTELYKPPPVSNVGVFFFFFFLDFVSLVTNVVLI